MQRILCVSHDASLTGAPMVLLHFVRWLQHQADVEVDVLLQRNGPLAKAFAAVAPTARIPFPPTTATSIPVWFDRSLFAAREYQESLRMMRQLQAGEYDVVLANTVDCGESVNFLAPFSTPIVCWVHELEKMIQWVERRGSFSTIRRHCNSFLAASGAVKRNLIQNHGVPAERIAVAHEFIPCPEPSTASRMERARQLRQEIGAAENALIVGGCGTTDARKGIDLFLESAAIVHRQRPEADIHFVWIGGSRFRWVTAALGFSPRPPRSKRIHFLGPRTGAANLMAAFDIFALTSREDPYPLVMLEAANQGLPIVCFEPSGGAVEFVESDCGVATPGFDVDTYSQALLGLVDNPERRLEYGRRAAEKVRERHAVEVGATHLMRSLQSFLAGVPVHGQR